MAQNTFYQQLRIRVPPRRPWQPELAEQFMQGLFAVSESSTLRIESHPYGLIWTISAQSALVQALAQTIYTIYPEATVELTDTTPAIGYQLYQFQAAAPFIMPLMYVTDYSRDIDPINLLLSALSRRQKLAHYIFEVQLTPVDRKQFEAGRKMLQKSNINWTQFVTFRGATTATLAKITGNDKSDRFDSHVQRLLEGKLNSPLRAVKLSFKARDVPSEVGNFLSLLKPALAVYKRSGINMLLPAPLKGSYPLVLSPLEVAALWHLPNEACAQADIAWSAGAVRPALLTSSVFDDVLIGYNRYQGKSKPVGIAYSDRNTHVNFIGKTGMGKTTVMHQMVRQDIARWKGVGVVDPHGDLVRDILHSSIPPERVEDVVLFSLRDYDYPIGLNLLAAPEALSSDIVSSYALAVLRKLFEDQWSATRMEDALYAALLALKSVPDSTIQDIPRLFADGAFRHQILSTITDPVALEFWLDEYEAYSLGQQQQIAQPINNRIRKLYRDKTMQRIVCQRSCLDFENILNSGKIFLADLGGPSEINTEVLGTLLISKIQMAAMSRSNLRPDLRQPFYLYVDELQHFTTTSLPTILSEARKYGLCLTMGNQFFYQLAGKTLEAVQGNIGATAIFRVGHRDAKAMAPFVRPQFSEQDLVNLNKYDVIMKMQRDGKTIPAFSMQTFPPPPLADNPEQLAEHIRHLSRTRFGRPKAEIDEELRHRFRRTAGTSANGNERSYLD